VDFVGAVLLPSFTTHDVSDDNYAFGLGRRR